MKFLTVTMISLLSLSAMAHNHDKDEQKMWDNMSFEDAKKMMQEKMDKKSAIMEKGKACVNAAKDKDGLKACKKDMWEEKDEMKAEMKDKMKKKS